jgi:transmembrane sensor
MESKARAESHEEVAAGWLLKRDSGQWHAADRAALEAWVNADVSHWVAFARVEEMWKRVDRMRVLDAGVSVGRAPARGTLSKSPLVSRNILALPEGAAVAPRRGERIPTALAASILLAAVLGGGAYVGLTSGTPYRTAIGGLATVPLEDGSSITLNTDTDLRVKVTAKERRVNLSRGEAFFEVAKDAARPFVVYAEGQRVVVLGTQFAVRIKPDAVQVVVADGAVRVDADPLLGADRALATLKPGYAAEVRGERIQVVELALPDIEQRLSWRSGYISVQLMPLGELVAEFNRYNHRKVAVSDPVAAGIRVTGNFRRDNVDGFVRMLRDGFGVEAQVRGDRIFLTRP